jgi:predicted signal transduction protein with EAL and GGDEF domain
MGDQAEPQRRGRTARVLVLAAALALAGGLTALTPRAPVLAHHQLSWWWLAVLFAVAETSVVSVVVRRESVSISVAEIPLVMGLFLATPADLLIGRVVGSAAIFLLVRRQTPVKAAFNTALVAGASASALAVFSLGAAIGGPLDAVTWIRAAAAACTAGVLEALCLTQVMSWYGEPLTLSRLGRELATSIAGPGLVSMAGVAAVLALDAGGSWLPLAVTGGLALLGYRSYAGLSSRYSRLERLHQLSGRLTTSLSTAAVTQGVLEETAELLRAGYVELLLPPAGRSQLPAAAAADGERAWRRWTLRHAGGVRGPHPFTGRTPDGAPLRLDASPRTSRTGRAFVADRGVGEALVAPLQIDDDHRGYLVVADRTGEERGFADGDLRLLETVAHQSAVALRGAGLVDRLHDEARHDELTGLPNRLAFREHLDARAPVLDAGGRLVVMLLDVDGFKAVNDTLGHHAGDVLLQELARRMDAAAAGDALVARLGGDEFAVLAAVPAAVRAVVPAGSGGSAAAGGGAVGDSAVGDGAVGGGAVGGGDVEPVMRDGDTSHVFTMALTLADRLLACFEEPVAMVGTRVRLGGSMGVAIGPDHGHTASDLLRNADIAMYAVKASGGGVRLYTHELVDVDICAVTVAGDLRDAIAGRQIRLELLPVVELATGVVSSVEVLPRWRHPELGEIPPEVFASAAEKSGQVAELSALVLDQALQLCRSWLERGWRIAIAVTVSPRRLADPTLPERVAELLACHGVPPELLCLEITEAGMVSEPASTLQTLGRLRSLGVRLSMDDFGTGVSSLTYLSRLPVHQLKIHHAFVSRVGDGPADLAVVRSILDLGRHLGLDVVAEGVSDVAAREALLDLGCRCGQGPLFGEPVSPERFPEILDRPLGGAGLPPRPRRPESAGRPQQTA